MKILHIFCNWLEPDLWFKYRFWYSNILSKNGHYRFFTILGITTIMTSIKEETAENIQELYDIMNDVDIRK